VDVPMLVAWSAGPRAEQFRGWSNERIIERALASLSNILPISKGELQLLFQEGFVHDWQADPFSLGAYTYLSVGSADAPEELARPIADRLFFAGEATDVNGDHATVHGALASGHRAADQVLSALR
jgi:monoamine oxidase